MLALQIDRIAEFAFEPALVVAACGYLKNLNSEIDDLFDQNFSRTLFKKIKIMKILSGKCFNLLFDGAPFLPFPPVTVFAPCRLQSQKGCLGAPFISP